MRRQVDSYSMLICSKYVKSISDMINITLVNSKFKDNIDKLHFNPFQINQNSRKYFSNLQTQWLFDEDDEIFSDGDISGYYVLYEVFYDNYLRMKNKYQNIKFRRIIYTDNDRKIYGYEIPNIVNKLGDSFFSYSNVKEIKIPDSIVEIGNCCFYNCHSLTSITLPSVLTSLKKGLFQECKELKTIEYSPFVVDLNDELFSGNGFSKITIPTSITRIGDKCFRYCKLTSLTIPSNVIEVGKEAFIYNIQLKEVELPNNMMQLSDGMFSGCCNLTKINIPSSLTKIGDGCFYSCNKLKEINLPMCVIEIGNGAFHHCTQLQLINGNVDVCIKYKDSFANTPFLKQHNKK